MGVSSFVRRLNLSHSGGGRCLILSCQISSLRSSIFSSMIIASFRMNGSRNSFCKGHICQCLSRLATLRRHSAVTVFCSRRRTGEQFVNGVLSLAAGLCHLGIGPGDVVAISAFNSDWYLEWLLAITYVGGIVAPLNYRWSLEESRSALEVVQPIMLVTDDSFPWHSEVLKETVPAFKWRVFLGSLGSIPDIIENVLTPEVLKRPNTESTSLCCRWAPNDVAIICFTSGTTGRPKGVTISHTAMIVQSLAKIAIVDYNEDDVYLHTAPLCHIGGISSALAMLMAGGCHVFIPKFEAKLAVEAIEQNHVTSFITVPAIMADFVSAIRLKKDWIGSKTVKKILNGGGSLSIELLRDVVAIFPSSKILSAYGEYLFRQANNFTKNSKPFKCGMTETCSSLTFTPLSDPTQRVKMIMHQEEGICVGKPAPHVEIMINGEDSSGVGKICTRGPHVMLQYWGQHNTTTLSPGLGGWFYTGDTGKLDHGGNLWLMGRDKDRIKSGGENIYPEEVEAILSQHPGIARVVVVGLPHPRLAEAAVACLQVEKDWRWTESSDIECVQGRNLCLSSEMLKQYCRKKGLSGYKIPKSFVVMRKPFPLTSTGKLRREQVRREALLCLHSLHSNL